jgi:hypothetical protein
LHPRAMRMLVIAIGLAVAVKYLVD